MEIQLSLSHLGYRPESPKTLTLLPAAPAGLPEVIPYYLRQNCFRMPRDARQREGFSTRFPCPYDLLRGRLVPDEGSYLRKGELRRKHTRWGHVWQADFSDFTTVGSYQIETDWQISPPFAIRERLYDRIISGYLTFLDSQRCGYEAFGVHEACHLDDGVLDSDGAPWPATGGWHDAGDFRKWLAFTLYHIEALATLHETVQRDLTQGGYSLNYLLEEIAWGNRFFHHMINNAGQVYEDLAGGSAPAGSGLEYERHWWFENHPGCYGDASDNRWTDNVPGSGDERKIRTTYNPLVQWAFVHVQARAAKCLPGVAGGQCMQLARRAAQFARRKGRDSRTLFLTAELRGNLELLAAGDSEVDHETLTLLVNQLLERQDCSEDGLSGFFLEAGGTDAFRSIGFAADPALALLRLWELRDLLVPGGVSVADRSREAVCRYIEKYLLTDAESNPFGLTPYGVYLNAQHCDQQSFRDAGQGRYVRTFIHPFNPQGIVHGTGSVLMSHAHLLARAGVLLGRQEWRHAAERLLHWSLGHNTLNRSLFTGFGYRQPVGYSFRIPQLPEALVNGFIGRPDDSPYLEESTAIEWNSLEYWSMPYLHAAQAACWLR